MRDRFRLMLVLVAVLVVAGSLGSWPESRGQAPPSFSVLLSNDDGYDAPGLRAMIAAFTAYADVTVAAPASEQSGKGHSITTSRDPIFVSERRQPDGKVWHAIEAPPATCVRLAVENLLPRRPELVISGINRGENLGITVYLSGTLGAAREAAVVGLPAMAVSMGGNDERDYAATARYVRELVEQLRTEQMLVPGLFLNINAPAGQPKGVRVTRLSVKPHQENYERRTSPRGRIYFWSRYRPLEDDDEGTDVWAFARGYITLTPMTLDATADRQMGSFRALEKQATGATQ